MRIAWQGLKHPRLGRPFWVVWAASLISTLGDGVRYVAFPLLAASLTRDPSAVATVAAAGYLPWPLFGLLGGAFVDRRDRRQLMWRTDLFRSVVVGSFAALVATQSAPVSMLAAVSFILGAAETFFDNAASSITPMLVQKESIERANSWLFSTQTLMLTLVGAPVGGALFSISGVVPIATDSITFAAAAALVASIGGSYFARAAVPNATVWQDISAGLRWLWRERLLRTLCLLLTVINFTFAAGESVLVLYALEVLHIGKLGYSLLLALLAVGGLLGALVAPWLRRMLGLRSIVFLAASGQIVGLALAGTTSDIVVTAPALAVVGVTSMVWSVTTVSLRQRVVPAALLGRVTSSYRVAGLAAMPIGAAVGGILAKNYGLHAPYLIGSVLLAAATLFCLPFIHSSERGSSDARSG